MQVIRPPAGGLRMKSMEQFVVTASASGPIRARIARYIATSASANIVGPETVPPGRRWRSAGASATRRCSGVASSTVKSSETWGNASPRKACSSATSIASAIPVPPRPFAA